MPAEHLLAGETAASQYDIGNIRHCERHPHGFVNTTYRIETDRGVFALTEFQQRTAREAAARAEVVGQVCAVPVAQPLLSRSGHRVIDMNGRPAWLTPWVEGRSLVGWQHHQKDPMSERQHREVIRGFDTLHRELSRIVAEGADIRPFQTGSAEEETEIPPGRTIQSLIARCRECYQGVAAPAAPQTSLVHRDFERQNLLFCGDALTAILDFDALGIGTVQQEWAHTTFNHACCDPQQSAEHLEMYVEHSPLGEMQKLSRQQFLAAIARFCEEDIHGFLWIAGRTSVDLEALLQHYSAALSFAQQHLD
ncbi:MAG: phosphotransferase [Candidatus Peribacteraceae bacterium]|nr:phosphotransferase [Candidatus Peribacteraceae bacterium]MDD5739306.1 phosphotransferase [Candidatus Peribacteraceae bacterium]